ncbi:MAG: class I tRNA ligase family protein, partial [Gammaproteobacteria bacterium]
AEAMLRWLAPILSFTAEEAWQFLPGKRPASVFLAEWHALPRVIVDTAAWDTLLKVRDAVRKELEKLRIAGTIGSSLDAEADLYCDAPLASPLRKFGDELRYLFITSYARVHPAGQQPREAEPTAELPGLWLVTRPSAHAKCARCWHHREDVGRHPEHPALCGRCVQNVEGAGEQREFA